MAEDIRAKLKIDGLTEAEKGLDKVATAAEDVGKALEEPESAGKQLAAALKASAAEIEAALKADAEAAEALGQALGPELSSRMNVDSAVADLKKLGLTADEVKADAAALADAIKTLDDVEVGKVSGEVDQLGGSLDKAKTGTDEMTDSARGANSALANMVGNSAQDIGALSGVAGSAGVALGQMAEYAADARLGGEGLGSALKSMAKVAVPIAGVSAVMWAISRGAKQAAERTKELEENISDLATVSDKAFKEETLRVWAQMMQRAALDGKSLQDQLKELATDNIVGARRMLDNADAIGLNAEAQRMLADAIYEADAAAIEQAENNERYGDSFAGATDLVKGLADALKAGQNNAKGFGSGVDIGSKALKGLKDAGEDADRAVAELEAQWQALSDAIDQDQSWLDLQTQFDNVKQSAIDAFAAAAEGSADAEQKARDYQSEVNSLKQDVIAYGAEVLGLPPEQVTRILADIDNGSLDEAERLLDGLARTRTAAVNVILTGLNLGTQLANALAGLGRGVTVTPGMAPTPAALGPGVEAQADLVLAPAVGSSVVQVSRPASTSVTNIVNVPRGYREIDAANALYRNQRRSGRLYANI
jgi:hypothetical protein